MWTTLILSIVVLGEIFTAEAGKRLILDLIEMGKKIKEEMDIIWK